MLKEIGAGWLKDSGALSITLDDEKMVGMEKKKEGKTFIVITANKYKKEDKHPDYKVYAPFAGEVKEKKPTLFSDKVDDGLPF